jgi:HAD superfamily hydrolase (TIGR01509 family)
MSRLVILLDIGGVVSDPLRRKGEWQRLVGAWFAPRLGGPARAWREANRIVVERLSDPGLVNADTFADFVSFSRYAQHEWVRGMCELVGVPPPSEDACLALAASATAALAPHVRAAMPGAAEAIRTLHRAGYRLHTASGSSSTEIAGYLDGMGVRDCFGRLYGADLINTFKDGPAYYARLFADASISPAEALVVDDSPQAVAWAAQSGAGAVLVRGASHAEPDVDHAESGAIVRIAALADLPTILQHCGRRQIRTREGRR